MKNTLLTKAVASLVAGKARSNEYGVSIVGINGIDYPSLLNQLVLQKSIQVFYLGFSVEEANEISDQLPQDVAFSTSIEDAEASRNSGAEDIFRIIILKHSGLEKTSSLRWFPEITLRKVYTKSCEMAKKELPGCNDVIGSLLQALKSAQLQKLLSFERVLDYLQLLTLSDATRLPEMVTKHFYTLGLFADSHIMDGKPDKAVFVARIKKNHDLVDRISNLDQAERQSITNYNAREDARTDISQGIMRYYRTQNVELLSKLDLSLVEECLKAVRGNPQPSRRSTKTVVNPTTAAAQMVFDDNTQQIDDVLATLGEEIDKHSESKKSERVEVPVNNAKLQVRTEPLTEKIAVELTTGDDMGCVIEAEVHSPDEAIKDMEKYRYRLLRKSDLDTILDKLERISSLLPEGESISSCLRHFIEAREQIAPYKKRLQDVPMLQVLSKHPLFSEYIHAYEKLLNAINEEFHRIWALAPSNAKEIINFVMSLDYVFVVGKSNTHALPTPLHPLYLWKYVELAREILDSKGLSGLDENALNEDDKSFIIRKADDIPDPLSVMLIPATIALSGPQFIPLSGRLGALPVYSSVPQINQSESGVDTLKQSIIRYLCLYPHAGMHLRIALVDPPSVEVVVSMLKSLNSDREFHVDGIDVSIFRTKEVPASWVEIEDDSLNDGMLGHYKGKRSLDFSLRIINQTKRYSEILDEISTEQHILVVFDPNEIRIETAQNNKHVHIHPLCVPKIYQYNPIDQEVEIRPASEGGIFTVYASILEKLNEHPSTFSHTSTFFRTPLKEDTYRQLLNKADWLVILDQSLKSWDISLRAASEKLYYRENDYRSVGIYSKHCNKFILGYSELINELGNFVPQDNGIKRVIEAVREINDDGLLSIVSHTSNRIFDKRHGKGSLGVAIAAIRYKQQKPDSLLVGLDTQLAKEWLSNREDGRLPDLVGIRFDDAGNAAIDLIEVKTYCNSMESFVVENDTIKGHAVDQVSILEGLMREICGVTERITTVSRREILREQVFESLFQSSIEPVEKRELSEKLNNLFAGQLMVSLSKCIFFIDFEQPISNEKELKAFESDARITLVTVGSQEIQCILTGITYTPSAIPETEKRVTDETETPPSAAEEDADECTDSHDVELETHSEATSTDVELSETAKRIANKCARINQVFRAYDIEAINVTPEQVQEAARFTRFKVQLRPGAQESSLKKRIRDIERELESNGEILVDHIKGTKYLSVDVPFAGESKPLKLTDHLSSLNELDMRLPFVAGQLPDGRYCNIDLAGAPHMLVAGTTGSGKTIFLYSILVSLLHKYSAEHLSLLIIDPKMTDFTFFEGLPHLYGGKVITDADKALEMLQKINDEDKEQRTALLQSCRSRDIESYNSKNPSQPMKRLVVVIDEYSDLIQAAEALNTRKDFEKNLLMLLQRVRNLGIHLVIATQRPSAQIVTGALKAVIPFRVSFRLPSHTDSQTILDKPGAENLLGKGDMLMVTESDTMRMQGLYISESELEQFLSEKQV